MNFVSSESFVSSENHSIRPARGDQAPLYHLAPHAIVTDCACVRACVRARLHVWRERGREVEREVGREVGRVGGGGQRETQSQSQRQRQRQTAINRISSRHQWAARRPYTLLLAAGGTGGAA